MDYFVPNHIKGYFATDAQRAAAVKVGRDPDRAGMPYEFFRGIHHIPDALADSHHANDLGIVPVEEMSDEDWRLLALDKDAWMAANRPAPAVVDAPEEKAEDVEPEPRAHSVATDSKPAVVAPAVVASTSAATATDAKA